MKLLATLDSDAAPDVIERLSSAGVACEARTVTEESGGVATELLVQDSLYQTACDVVDAWLEDQHRMAGMTCPKCQSSELERVPHDSVEVLFRCKACGCDVFTFRNDVA